MKKEIQIEGMHCAHCVARVEKALAELGENVIVELESGVATLETDCENQAVKDAVEDLGFVVKEVK